MITHLVLKHYGASDEGSIQHIIFMTSDGLHPQWACHLYVTTETTVLLVPATADDKIEAFTVAIANTIEVLGADFGLSLNPMFIEQLPADLQHDLIDGYLKRKRYDSE